MLYLSSKYLVRPRSEVLRLCLARECLDAQFVNHAIADLAPDPKPPSTSMGTSTWVLKG